MPTHMTKKQIAQDLNQLSRIDSDVARGLELVGFPPPRRRVKGLPALMDIIIGQQISTFAAKAVVDRLDERWPEKDAASFLALGSETLTEIGFSRRKIEYANGLAEAVLAGDLNFTKLHRMDDQALVHQLCSYRGIGVWSAEIYCMFSLGRTDIFAADDLALQEALKRLKGLEARPTAKQARELVAHWSPWRSAGSLFLWKFYRGAPEFSD